MSAKYPSANTRDDRVDHEERHRDEQQQEALDDDARDVVEHAGERPLGGLGDRELEVGLRHPLDVLERAAEQVRGELAGGGRAGTGRELDVDVDVVVGVAQPARDRLVLDHPAVGAVEGERGEAAQPGRLLQRLLVGPDGVLADVVAGAQGPVGGHALERAVRRRLGALHERGVEVLQRHVGDGPDAGLVQEVRARRVEHERVADVRAQAPPVGLEEDPVRGPRSCSSSRLRRARAARCPG